jgi:hypothetical protein
MRALARDRSSDAHLPPVHRSPPRPRWGICGGVGWGASPVNLRKKGAASPNAAALTPILSPQRKRRNDAAGRWPVKSYRGRVRSFPCVWPVRVVLAARFIVEPRVSRRQSAPPCVGKVAPPSNVKIRRLGVRSRTFQSSLEEQRGRGRKRDRVRLVHRRPTNSENDYRRATALRCASIS